MTTNLEDYTVKELNVFAKKLGLSGYSKLAKKELLRFIKNNMSNGIDKCKTKKCVPKDICNPESGRCVSKEGKIGKNVIQNVKEDEWIIFTLNSCSSCTKAKELFNSLKIKYNQIEVKESERKNVLSELKDITSNYKYFPIIFKNKIFIGGYDDLNKMFTPRPDISKIHMMNPIHMSKINFAGYPWEDLVSMLYIMHQHPKECVAIPIGLLTSSGKLTSKAQKVKQFFDTSLEWSEKKNNFVVPVGLWNSVKSCLAKESKFIVMPFGFNCINGLAHANFLVYNSETKELERFDPHGVIQNACLNPPRFAEKLGKLFNDNVKRGMVKKVYDPLDYCPVISFQYIQEGEIKEKKPDDPRGFCIAWSAWYADTRLSNPNKSREDVVKMSLKELKDRPTSFTEFIRNYAGFLEKVGKELKRGKSPGDVFTKYIQKYT
jgi:glutaredoxin